MVATLGTCAGWLRAQTLRRRASAAAVAVLVAAGLAGCASSDSFSLPKLNDINPFAKKEPPMPGTRIPIMTASAGSSVTNNLAPANQPVVLPGQVANDDWSQPGGTSNNAPGHLAFAGSGKRIWSASAGTGSSSSGKVTASPIVYGGRIFTLDAAARVTAFTTSGSRVWSASLVPDKESSAGSGILPSLSFSGGSARGGYGGGLAADGGRLYAASGFGLLTAFDPATGKVLWTKNVKAPVRASPTAFADRVIVSTREGRVIAYAGSDGSELWSVSAVPEQASFIHSPSPATDGEYVVTPFSSGEIMTLRVGTGETVWSDSLTRRRGGSAMAALSDVARPVIDRGMVFAVGHGGRMVAAQVATGERVWSANVSGTQPPWVAGDYVFVVDRGGQLMALNRADGLTIWTTQLSGARTWSGPTLAGGKLWLVSSKGALAAVDATTGKLLGQSTLGSAAYVAPIVAGGRMYILTDSARLLAYN